MTLENMVILAQENDVLMIGNPDNNKMYAYINGRFYHPVTFRPVDGEGRKLREENRNTIKSLYTTAFDKLMNLPKPGEVKEVIKEVEVVKEVEKTSSNPAYDAFQTMLLECTAKASQDALIDKALPAIKNALINEFGIMPQTHEFKFPDRPDIKVQGVMHKDFDAIVAVVQCGHYPYLVGPAGTGKSFIAEQVAKVLNLDYHATNCVMDEIQLKGFIDANGTYHETAFYRAFVNGGLFLLDEMDASDANALNLLNQALANKTFEFPNVGTVKAHPDFHCIATGNTYGTGADSVYIGRNQQDGANLDRFAMIPVGYDREIELAMTNNDTALVDFVEDFRTACETTGINCLATYRAIKRLYDFGDLMPKATAIRIGLTKGLGADDIKFIHNSMTVHNEWTQALEELIH